MLIGVSTASYFGKLCTEDSLLITKRAGADVLEVFMTTLSEYEPGFGDLLKERLNNQIVHSIHTLNSQFEPQLFHTALRTAQDAEVIFKKALANGAKLHATYYTFHGPAKLKKTPYRMDYPKLGYRLNELYDIAATFGICISYENVHWAYYDAPGYYTQLKKYCPRLKGTLDIKQAYQSKADYRDFLLEMRQDITTVHVCDYLENGSTTSIGKGIFDFKQLFHLLKEEGVTAPVLVELYAGDYDSCDIVSENIAYLKSLRT